MKKKMTKILLKYLFIDEDFEFDATYSINKYGLGFIYDQTDIVFSSNAIDMLRFTTMKVGNEVVYIGDKPDDEVYMEINGKIVAYLNYSSRYYDKMLTLYKSQEDKLLKEIVSKYGISEMPQNATMNEIEKSQENDLSNVRVQLTEANTAMGRLSEIQKSYRNLLEEWSDEFINKFIIYESGCSYMEEIKENEKNG